MSVYIFLNNTTRYESRWFGILWLASDVSLLGDAILEKRLLLLLSSGFRSGKTIARFYLYPRNGHNHGTCHGSQTYCHKGLDDVVECMGCARCPRAQVRPDLTGVTPSHGDCTGIHILKRCKWATSRSRNPLPLVGMYAYMPD